MNFWRELRSDNPIYMPNYAIDGDGSGGEGDGEAWRSE